MSINSYAGYLTSVELSKDIADYLKEFYNYDTGHDITKPIMELSNDVLIIINTQLNKIIKTKKCLSYTAFIDYDDSCLKVENKKELNTYTKKIKVIKKITSIYNSMSETLNSMDQNIKELTSLAEVNPDLKEAINPILEDMYSFITKYEHLSEIYPLNVHEHDIKYLEGILKPSKLEK